MIEQRSGATLGSDAGVACIAGTENLDGTWTAPDSDPMREKPASSLTYGRHGRPGRAPVLTEHIVHPRNQRRRQVVGAFLMHFQRRCRRSRVGPIPDHHLFRHSRPGPANWRRYACAACVGFPRSLLYTLPFFLKEKGPSNPSNPSIHQRPSAFVDIRQPVHRRPTPSNSQRAPPAAEPATMAPPVASEQH
jgi:hypothetical protein